MSRIVGLKSCTFKTHYTRCKKHNNYFIRAISVQSEQYCGEPGTEVRGPTGSTTHRDREPGQDPCPPVSTLCSRIYIHYTLHTFYTGQSILYQVEDPYSPRTYIKSADLNSNTSLIGINWTFPTKTSSYFFRRIVMKRGGEWGGEGTRNREPSETIIPR